MVARTADCDFNSAGAALGSHRRFGSSAVYLHFILVIKTLKHENMKTLAS